MRLLSVKKYGVALKATIQSTGKLGFTGATARALELATRNYVRFFQDDEPTDVLYMSVMEGEDEEAFFVMQSSGNYYINTRPLFERLGVEYKSRSVIYDLQRAAEFDVELGGEAYRMMPRYMPRRGDQDDGADETDQTDAD